MVKTRERKSKKTEAIEAAFKSAGYEVVEAYHYNSASIRVRVIDKKFASKSRNQREKMALKVVHALPEDIQLDIIFLLLLAPDETDESLMNLEFEDPSPTRL